MKRIYAVALLAVALCAIAGVSAAAASAETIPMWLVNGSPIALGERVNVDVLPAAAPNEHILVEDMNASAAGNPDILCEIAKSLGWLLPNGEGEIVEGECLVLEIMQGTCGSPLVVPVHLPWTTLLLEPVLNDFVVDITAGTGGEPGWLAECTVLGVKIDDTCTSLTGEALVTNLADGLLEGTFLEEKTANCSVGGANQGLVGGSFLLHALNAAGELIPLAASLETETI